MGLQPAAVGGASRYVNYIRASGLAQARLQVAVLSGNRRRALEQIDRLVALDKELERGSGEALPEWIDNLAEERLALASEKLVLTSEIALPRLEPAFGAGYGAAIAPDEPVEIVEDDRVRRRAVTTLVACLAFFALCAVLGAALL